MSSQKSNTLFATDITLTEAKRQYDIEAKNLLSYRCIASWILKCCTDEFAGYSLAEINKCLGDKGTELTGDGKIQLMNNKDNLPGVIPIEFDLRFNVITPYGEMLQFDIEPQKEDPKDEILKNRGCYYCSRMISSQSNTVFQKDHYQDMQKVYSIWIISNGGSRTNTIDKYVLQNVNDENDVLSIMKLIYIYLGDPDEEGISEILQLLDTIFYATITIEEIISVLEDRFHIRMTNVMKEVVKNMCNFSDAIQERAEARAEARAKARAEEKTKRIAMKLFANQTPLESIADILETTVEKVKQWLNLQS